MACWCYRHGKWFLRDGGTGEVFARVQRGALSKMWFGIAEEGEVSSPSLQQCMRRVERLVRLRKNVPEVP